MKRLLAILLATLLVLSAFAGALAEEKLYIPVIAKGMHNQFWEAVNDGAQAAADELGVTVGFYGPANESGIDEQVEILKEEVAKNPAVIALAALSTESVVETLLECKSKGIPIIGFDSGVPDAPEGVIVANVATDNYSAAALAAETLMEQERFVEMLQAGTADKPVVIAVVSHDAVSESIIARTSGFVDKMKELASTCNTVSVTGHELWKNEVANAGVIISVIIAETNDEVGIANAVTAALQTENLNVVFLTNEDTVNGLLDATNDGADLGEGGRYAGLIVAGFDAGGRQKYAVKQGWFIGSVTQDPYMIGYYAVVLAYKAASGVGLLDVYTSAQWYNSWNIEQPEIAMLLYD